MSTDDLVSRDAASVWHPYAAPVLDPPPVPVVGTSGVRIELADGTRLVDGMASWWSAIHGYGHPSLVEAVARQAARMSHVMFGGLTHEPAVRLAERLCAMAPGAPERVFFSDSGSVAVEVALKMALQFWRARGDQQRTRIVALRGGYHGDTFGTMAVSDPDTGMHSMWSGALAEQLFAPRPAPRFDALCAESDLAGLEQVLRDKGAGVAAVILEPVVQGAGGMWFYAPAYLRGVRELCDRHGVLLIADEIATGFGRTGKLFACEHAPVAPDILCVGKALTGGMLSFAATLASREVCDVIGGGEPGVLMHGPTFMGNPLACAAALANLDLLGTGAWEGQVSGIELQLRRELALAERLPGVADVRVLGAIGVVELERPIAMAEAQRAFVERGVWVRPFGKLVYVMPPYIIEPAELARLTGAIVEVVGEFAVRP